MDVLIDFQVDYSQLDDAVTTLQKSGKVTDQMAAGFKKVSTEATKAGTTLKGPVKSIGDLDARSKKFVTEFIKGFQQGVTEELKHAKVEIDAMRAKFETAGVSSVKATGSIRQELKNLTQQIAAQKAAGGPISQQDIQRAGQLKDAIADANAEIKNAGSDTRSIDNLVGSVSALAGGFAAVQGAVGLFADENEDLQKALLKVNSAMAFATGLQQVANALQKEGAITLAILNVQQKVQNAALALQGATESKNIVIRYAAIAAQKLLNAAMASSPVGLLLAGLAAVVTALIAYTQNAGAAARAATDLAIANKNLGENLEDSQSALALSNRNLITIYKQRGAAASELTRLEIDNLRQQIIINNQAIKTVQGKLFTEEEAANKRKEIDAINIKSANLNADIAEKQAQLAKDLADEEKKSAEDRKKAQEDREAADAKALERRKTGIADNIALLKTEQLQYDESTTTYRRLEQAIINLQGRYDSLGLSAAQAGFAIANAAKRADAVDLSSKVNTGLRDIEKQTIDTTKAIQGVAQQVGLTVQTTATDTITTFEDVLKDVNIGLSALNDVASRFNEISKTKQENLQLEFDIQQRNIEKLLEAGAITEKEATARQSRLDRARQIAEVRAARQEKQLAIFSAIINTATAVTKALTAGPIIGPILAVATAALGAIQIKLISARPIPAFASGKKGSYSGPGIVGEAGAELVEQGGRMWVANKATPVYLGPRDKVYTASETRVMLPHVRAGVMKKGSEVGGFDYSRMAKAMGGSHGPSISIDKDFIRESVADGLRQSSYYQRRYRS